MSYESIEIFVQHYFQHLVKNGKDVGNSIFDCMNSSLFGYYNILPIDLSNY